VSGATVILPRAGTRGLTDDEGTFFFDLPPRDYDVIAQARGFESVRVLDVVVTDEGHSITIELVPNAAAGPDSSVMKFEMGEVTVTASRVESLVQETPREVRVIDAATIGESVPVGTPEALDALPEVLVQKTSLGGGAPIMRGLSGNRVLLMVDGVRLNNSTYRIGLNQYLNTIDPGSVARIEVVPGPGSVLYGSDALGGVVQVFTAEPAAARPRIRYAGQVSAAEGSHTHAVQAARWWGSGGVVVGAGFRDLQDLRGGDGVQSPTGYSEWSTNARAAVERGRGTFSFGGQLTHQKDVPRFDRVDAGKDSLYVYDPQNRELLFARGEFVRPTSWMQFAGVTASWNHQREGRRIVAADDTDIEETFLDDTATFGVSAEARSLLGDRTFAVYGADLFVDDVDSEGEVFDSSRGIAEDVPGKFPDDGTHTQLGVFAQAEHAISPRLTVIGAARYSHFTLEGTPQGPTGFVSLKNQVVTGSLQSRIALSTDDYLFVGVSQAFRSPNMEDALSTGLSNKGFDVPNPALDPEKSVSFEVGIKTRGFVDTDDWQNETRKMFSASATAYVSRIDDLIERTPATFMGSDSLDGAPVFRNENLGRAVIAGFTANGRVRVHRDWRISGALAFTHGENTDLDVPLTRIPPPRGRLQVRYDPGGGAWIEASLNAAAEQSRLSPDDLRDSRIDPGGTPGYVIPTLRVGRRVNDQLRLTLVVENPGDVTYRVHGSGIDMPGRNATLGVRWEIQ
jgi:outer membrane receptor protein involved in Fe transport